MSPFMEYQEKIGEYLVRVREIRPHQVENILLRQQCGDRRRFGEIAVDLRYIEKKALERLLVTSELPLWKRPYKLESVSREQRNQVPQGRNV